MTVVQRLVEAGGLSTRAALLAQCDRIEIDKALAAGEIVAVGRGRYALPIVDEGVSTGTRIVWTAEPDQRGAPPRVGGQDRS